MHITNTIASSRSQLTRSASGYQPIFASMCSARIVIPRLVGGVIEHYYTDSDLIRCIHPITTDEWMSRRSSLMIDLGSKTEASECIGGGHFQKEIQRLFTRSFRPKREVSAAVLCSSSSPPDSPRASCHVLPTTCRPHPCTVRPFWLLGSRCT